MKKIKLLIAFLFVIAMSITGIKLSGVRAYADDYEHYYRIHSALDDSYTTRDNNWGSFYYNGVFYDVSKWYNDRSDHKIVVNSPFQYAFEYDIDKKELHVKGSGEIHIDTALIFNVDIDGMMIVFDNPVSINRHYKSGEDVSDILYLLGDTTIKTNGKVELISCDYRDAKDKESHEAKISCGIYMRDSRNLTFDDADIEILAYEGIVLDYVQSSAKEFYGKEHTILGDHTYEEYKKSRLDIKNSNIKINCTGMAIEEFSNEITLTDCYIINPEGAEVVSRFDFRPGKFKEMSDTIYWINSDSYAIFKNPITRYLEITNKYPVWLGENQVSVKNKAAIPGVTGGTAQYDPETKTLTFTGDVTGIEGIYEGGIYNAKIYAKDDLTIIGNAKLEDGTSECCGIVFEKANGTLTIDGNLGIKSKKYGIVDTEKDSDERANLVINGNVDIESENNMLIFGNVKVNPSASITAKQSGNEEVHNGVFETNSITVDGGSLKVIATNAERVIHCDDTFSISIGNVEAVGQHKALRAENGITLTDVKISVPDEGVLGGDGVVIMDGDNEASTVKIVPVTYNVVFDVKGHGTAPATQTVIKNKTADKPENPSATCEIFGGWYIDEAFTTEYNFSSPVTTDVTLYAKWTENHTPKEAVRENEVPATCTLDGSYDEVVYCSVCNAELSRTKKTISAVGHTPKDAVKENEVSANCNTDGSYDEVVYCSVCSEEISRTKKTVSATGHTPKEAVKENEVAATCTTDGSYDEVVYCSICNEEISRTKKSLPAIGHTPGEFEVQTPATENTDGTEVKKCKTCGTVVETKSIPATGSNGGNNGGKNGGENIGGNNGGENISGNNGGNIGGGENISGNQGGNISGGENISGNQGGNNGGNNSGNVGGGSSSGGSTGGSSSGNVGGGSSGGIIVVPSPSSSTKPDETVTTSPTPIATPSITPEVKEVKKGSVLNDSRKQAEYIVTSVNSASPEVSYNASLDKNKKVVSVPQTVKIDGVTYKVTSISANAFKGNESVTKISIGSNVTIIGKNAFYGCTSLTSVSIPKSVKTIESGAFRNCSSLKKVTIGANVTKIGSYAFSGCKALTELTIPKNVKSIGKNSFSGCSALKKLTIKTKKLTSKSVANAVFKAIPADCKIIIPASKESAYKKLLVKKGLKNTEEITVSKKF